MEIYQNKMQCKIAMTISEKICLCDYWLVLDANGKECVSMSWNPVQSASYHNQKWSQRSAY